MGLITQVKRRIQDTMDSIDDSMFFSSYAYREYLTKFVNSIALDAHRKICLTLTTSKDVTAYTNGNLVCIGTESDFVSRQPNRKQKHAAIKGLAEHEMGHVLYTNFPIYNAAQKNMESGLWYPSAPYPEDEATDEATNTAEIMEMIHNNPVIGREVVTIWHHIHNILEDAYIEAKFCEEYPGCSEEICTMNIIIYADSVPIEDDVEKADEADTDLKKASMKLSCVLSNLLVFALFGDFKCDENHSSDVLDTIYRCIPFVNSSIFNEDPYNRINMVNKIMVEVWPYMREVVSAASAQNQPQGQVDQTVMTTLRQIANQLQQQMSFAPNSSSLPIKTNSGNIQQARRNATGNTNANIQPQQGNDPNGQPQQGNDPNGQPQQGNDPNGQPQQGNDPNGQPQQGNDPNGQPQQGNDQNPGQVGQNSQGNSEPGSGAGLGGSDAELEREINNIVRQIAQQMAEEAVQAEQMEQMQQDINGIPGCRGIVISRPISVTADMQDRYMRRATKPQNGSNVSLLQISKKLQRKMEEVLKGREGGKLTRLPIGNRICMNDLVHDDEFFFQKTKLPQDKSDLAVMILIDESGSMRGQNIAAAIDTSIILEDFLRNMQIPFGIYGHSDERSGCELYCYSEFDKADDKDRYRLMTLSARGGTPTATALTALYDKMKKRQEGNKLIIVITDGQPGDNYGNQIQTMVRESHRHGIEIFGVGIAGAAKKLRDIYGERTIAIDDLSELPNAMVRLIKRFVRFV